MIFRITLKELKENLREGRIRLSLLIVLALLLVSVFISRGYYLSVQQQHAEAKEAARDVWVSQDEKNPHSAAHFGTYAFKPKYPLALIDQGVDKYAGISIYLEAHNRNEAQYMAAADQTALSRFGELTPDFILLFIIPLLIILISYNAFSRENEQGTLRLLKSQGLNMWSLAMGKWWSVFLPVMLLCCLLFGVAAIFLGSLEDFGTLAPAELLIMLLVFLLYYAVFINLSLLVSALSKNSGISLVLLLSIWILSCLAAPKAANNLANGLHPYPTRMAFEAAIAEDKKNGLDGHDPWNQEAIRLEKAVLTEYGVDSLHQLPFNFDGYRMQKSEEHEADIYFKHYAYLREQHERQTDIYQATALFSPFLPARFLSMAIARTDYHTHWDFADAAENYRIQMQAALNNDFAQKTSYGDWSYKADRKLWESIPDFSYDPPELGEILQTNVLNIVILLLWFGLSLGGLFFATSKL